MDGQTDRKARNRALADAIVIAGLLLFTFYKSGLLHRISPMVQFVGSLMLAVDCFLQSRSRGAFDSMCGTLARVTLTRINQQRTDSKGEIHTNSVVMSASVVLLSVGFTRSICAVSSLPASYVAAVYWWTVVPYWLSVLYLAWTLVGLLTLGIVQWSKESQRGLLAGWGAVVIALGALVDLVAGR
jgi:hypothetical protein